MANNHSQYEQLKNIINEKHNPSLVKPEEQPNGNIIFHLYSSGEITFQKGGWAYLCRSEFTESWMSLKKNYSELFPVKSDGRSYAIVTREDAYYIQKLMKEMEC